MSRHLKSAPEDREEWLRPHEIIERYGIKRTRLYKLLRAGEIPSAKVGRTRHVKRTDLEDFMDLHIKA